jgi:hypothetical protein
MKLRPALKLFFLAFLLLSLQLEARVHVLSHLGDRLRASAEQGAVAVAVHPACATCELLAGGCDAPASGDAPARFAVAALGVPPAPAPSEGAGPLFAYLSRGPPVLS